MEVRSTNREGVAEPGQVVSGTAGTGQKQGIKTGNAGKTEEKSPHVTHTRVVTMETIFPKDSTLSRNAGKKSAGHGCATRRSGLERYHRRRAFVMREVPLYMLPAALRRGVKERGGKIYRAVIVRTHWNHYTIKIRCNTKKATGHRSQLRRRDQTLATFSSGEGDADG